MYYLYIDPRIALNNFKNVWDNPYGVTAHDDDDNIDADSGEHHLALPHCLLQPDIGLMVTMCHIPPEQIYLLQYSQNSGADCPCALLFS